MQPEVDETRSVHEKILHPDTHEPVPHDSVKKGMRRFLLITFLLAVATGAADPKRSVEFERAHQDMVVAQRMLEDAKQRRDGKEPERGTDKSMTRPTPEYFDQHRALERAVALAQWRYEQATERWSALR